MIYYSGSPNGGPHMTIYTIGHSNVAVEGFVDLLRLQLIQMLVDTRSQRHTRYAPQFNRKPLKTWLDYAEIAYLYLGDKRRDRLPSPQFLPTGRVEYVPRHHVSADHGIRHSLQTSPGICAYRRAAKPGRQDARLASLGNLV
jgi:hypothetical protein